MRALEERVAAVEGALAVSHQQQDARSVDNLDSSLGSQRRSSIASTEQPAGGPTEVVANEPHHDPMDDITVRTPCEHLYQQRKKIKLVAHGIAEVPIQSGTVHDVQIPEGYARVMVDRVERG